VGALALIMNSVKIVAGPVNCYVSRSRKPSAARKEIAGKWFYHGKFLEQPPHGYG
jgi:hypothetical protein